MRLTSRLDLAKRGFEHEPLGNRHAGRHPRAWVRVRLLNWEQLGHECPKSHTQLRSIEGAGSIGRPRPGYIVPPSHTCIGEAKGFQVEHRRHPTRRVVHLGALVLAVADSLCSKANWSASLGSVVDITDLKHAEAALRESEQQFRTFVDDASDAFFLLDERMVVLDVNRRACQSLGYTRDELVGMTPTILHADITPADL